MNRFRILLLSNTRPSRAWKIAARIAEISNVEMCGLVQRPMQTLSLAQQIIAGCASQRSCSSASPLSAARHWLASALNRLLEVALWWVHGCPRNLKKPRRFTVERLAEEFRRTGWPFLVAEGFGQTNVADFIRNQSPDLIIVLGEFWPQLEQLHPPSQGLISARQREIKPNEATIRAGYEIKLEHHTKGEEHAAVITCLNLPLQPYDAFPELTLKTDLIADDLLLQTAIQLQAADRARAAEAVARWADSMFAPYLRQFETAPGVTTTHTVCAPQRFRSAWKLCMHTLLLCSPFIAGRNWYRRWRGRFPVLILAHHLVSDRPHRMGISTAQFLQQIRFLQKHYQFVTLSEATKLLRSAEVHVPTLALTFDDGYADNFLSLRAVVEETGVPVALFVVVEAVENHREFQHDLETGSKGTLPLTWEQIRYWNAGGAEVGSHTRTHFDCGSANHARLQLEIVASKTELEGHLGKPVKFFAFPFGKQENISLPALELAKSTYPHVLSCFGGENTPQGAGNYQHLLRKTHYSHPWELELELQSVFDLVKTLKEAFHALRARGADLPMKLRVLAGRIQQPELPATD